MMNYEKQGSSILLDTNIISELIKPKPNKNVIKWLNNQDEDNVFISVITVSEVNFGILRNKNNLNLSKWFKDDVLFRFTDRIIPINKDIALLGSTIKAQMMNDGIQINIMDAFIASTALISESILVTRNIKDFENIHNLKFINPFEFE